ncbi:MAG TPA: DinB family protein [Terriglobales bacterium]|jgi:hypothetical protein|nr:DinB family protein [Terriglobales bacterium]
MHFQLAEAVEVLTRTPATLNTMLRGLPQGWIRATEGRETWSPFDVVGHLIHGELTDWMPRLRIILEQGESRPFDPFDRFAQFENSKGKTLEQLLDEFSGLRAENVLDLNRLALRPEQFAVKGTHPALGTVTLGQLLATWVVHDLTHIVQISRVMAKRYGDDVGPWRAYLSVLNR